MSGSLERLLLLTSPFGDDTAGGQASLHALSFQASERLSQPFEIGLDVACNEAGADVASLLNQQISLTVRRKDGIDRCFNGVVRHVRRIGHENRGYWQYHLEMVPRLWFLSQTVDCRIFQQKTAVEILRQIFSENGVSPVEFHVSGSQPVREYTTQFNEDNLTFCHRVMQESGLFYYFEHSKSEHKLIVADNNGSFKRMSQPLHRVIWLGENVDIFDHWATGSGLAPGQVTVKDYDPERPSTPVRGQQNTQNAGPGAGQRTINRWPAQSTSNAVATDRARFHGESAGAAASLCHGHGFDPNMCPGFRFELAQDPSSGAEGVDYVSQEVRHSGRDETWVGGTEPSQYDCSFSCFKQETPWREPMTIARPTMTGIFSGIVLGEGGEEIHADKLARVKVRPLFDHREDTVASMAIWARVLHGWAGDRWGWQHLPRVGTEVGLSFMNGDCDNPVVLGCFYHEQQQPVFAVPAEQTKQGFRSRSTTGGGPSDYNELSFDDHLGQEMLFIHAQKDQKLEVEHDQTYEIGNDRSVTTKKNDSLVSSEGEITVTATAGSVTITAATKLVLKCGASSITLTPANIVIDGPLVNICPGGLP